MKRISIILLAVVMTFSLYACGSSKSGNASDGQQNDQENQLTGKHHVVISVKGYGDIKIELDADVAPVTVTNFVNLAKDGFYDGLTFHRIISGFMIQGGDPDSKGAVADSGDPKGDGTGGSDTKIKGEFADNGVTNNLSHTRGAISMARSSSNNSASSQFFIVHKDSTYLDGKYACFGYVTEGMDVVDKICKEVKPVDDNGKVNKNEQPVIEKVTVID